MGAYEDALARGKVKGRISQEQQINNTVSTLAPLATIYTTKTNAGVEQTPTVKVSSSSGTVLEQALKWVGDVSGQAIGLAGQGLKYIADEAVNTVNSFGKLINSANTMSQINKSTDEINSRTKANQKRMDNVISDYKAGIINSEEYKKSLKDIADENISISQMSEKNIQFANDNEFKVEDALNVVTTVASVAAAVGTGGLSTIAIEGKDIVTSQATKQLINVFGKSVPVSKNIYNAATTIDNIVKTVANAVNKVSTLNGALPAGQLVKITESTIQNAATNLTAKQIAKNVAINVLIKKPLIYQTNVDIASDIYKDLLKGDLNGAALSTIATGAMALSGGPIGLAFEMAGKAMKSVKGLSNVGVDIGTILANEAKNNVATGKANRITQKWIQEQAGKKVNANSFIDLLSTRISKGGSSQMYEAIVKRLENGEEHIAELMKVMEQTNLKMAHGDVNQAVKLVSDYYDEVFGSSYLRTHTADEILDEMVNHALVRDKIVQDAIKNGLSKGQASRIVVGRVTQSQLTDINKALYDAEKIVGKSAGEKLTKEETKKVIEARLAIITKMVDENRLSAWANSKSFMVQLRDIIKTSDYNEMSTKISKIVSSKKYNGVGKVGKISKEVSDFASSKGYIATMPEKTITPYVSMDSVNGSKLLTSEAGQTTDIFEQAVKPLPVLQHISKAFAKLGMSPEASQNKVYEAFNTNFNTLIHDSDNLGIKFGNKIANGEDIMNKINNFIRASNDLPISRKIIDPRQLTIKETMSALKCTRQQAKSVLASMNTAMLQVPFELRGLGDRVLDINSKLTGGLSQQYARTQGAGRYTYNPFFWLQQATQTEAFVQAEVAANKLGFKPLQVPGFGILNKTLFSEFASTTDDVVNYMKKKNIFSGGFSGEISGDVFTRIGSSITKNEQKSLAGLVQLQAKKMGYVLQNGKIDFESYISDHFESVVDTMNAMILHNKSQNVLDSPLVKTINLAFFPLRYNLKTSKLIADYIGKLSAPTQVAILANYYKADDWLKSDEGINWQAQYADAIKLFKWISPTYPLDYVLKLGRDLTDPDNASMGDLGMLGGVPFGFVSQMLEANGIIAPSSPYVNPKTGEVYPKYVPETTKAQVALSIQTFLGSLFSYPGSIVGLPSKGSLLRGFTNATVGGTYDTTAVSQENRLTPDQKRQVEVLTRNKPKENTTNQVQDNIVTVVNK